MIAANTEARPNGSTRGPWLPIVGVTLFIGVLTAFGIWQQYQHERQEQKARLEAISQLRAGQISRWLLERTQAGTFLIHSQNVANLYSDWRGGNPDSLRRLLERLVDVRKSSGYASVLVMDEAGEVIAGEAQADLRMSPELLATGQHALASGEPARSDLYGASGAAPAPRIDVVVPLAATGQPTRGAVVLRIDPQSFLFPALVEWPVPTTTGSSLIVRPVNGELVSLRGQTLSPAHRNTLAVRALRGDIPMDAAAEGYDIDGKEVLGVVSPIAGSNWSLVTRVDLSEIRSDAMPAVAMVAGLGLLAAIAACIAILQLRARQALALARVKTDEQERTLESLQLLDAIVRGSTDAIVGKSLAGIVLS